ncbi:MAG: DUF3899 domain-containing protein [Bacilli bacterium]
MSRKINIILSWSIAFITALALFLGVLCGRGNYSGYGFIDPCFYAGIIVFLLGCLLIVIHKGAFDIFAFGFGSIFSHMNPNRDAVSSYHDYAEYTIKKKRARMYSSSHCVPFLVIGGVFLLGALILNYLFNPVL